MGKTVLILILIAIALGGCANENTVPKPECAADSDCGIGGCSGQICATNEKAKDIITTCEYKASYECYKLTSCGCTEGRCSWKSNEKFSECLKREGG